MTFLFRTNEKGLKKLDSHPMKNATLIRLAVKYLYQNPTADTALDLPEDRNCKIRVDFSDKAFAELGELCEMYHLNECQIIYTALRNYFDYLEIKQADMYKRK